MELMSPDSTSHFLNVDLDIRNASGVRALVQALASSTIVVRLTDTEATLEHQEQAQTASEALMKLARLIEQLPPDARAVWDACEFRVMNVGIQAGRAPHQSLHPVSLDDMAIMLRIGADLLFTVYAAV